MTPLTYIRFLLGSRKAIETIASTKNVLWLGLLFVLSAGFAREYDGEDLLHEPWHLVLPLVASLATSFLLYVLVAFALDLREEPKPRNSFSFYPRFLALYWMTAPMAWLYAIPAERFQSLAEATTTNLRLLAIVAVWRVLLITRVLAVTHGVSFARAFGVVALFADSVMVALAFITPRPVLGMMSGVRLSETDQLISSVTCSMIILGVLTWLIWFGWACFSLRGKWTLPDPVPAEAPRVSSSLWALAGLSLVAWVFVLPRTQPEQQRRRSVETLLRGGRIEEGVELLASTPQEDFPPHWTPPPHVVYARGSEPPILDVMEVVLKTEPPPWVRELYVGRFRDHVKGVDYPGQLWRELKAEQLERYLDVLEQLPELQQLLSEGDRYSPMSQSLSGMFDPIDESGTPEWQAVQRERLRKLLNVTEPPTRTPDDADGDDPAPQSVAE